ncbi:dihydrolipoamide acetyltransferase family protein [Arthrobacter tecti]
MIKEFRLPDLGEGLTESEIVSWHVAVGDTVELNQVIADVETAKAVVELPSPYAGVVAKLHEQPGTVVEVGSPIVSFDIPGGESETAAEPDDDAAPAKREPNLVGYGAAVEKSGRPTRRARRGAAPTLPAKPADAPTVDEAEPAAVQDSFSPTDPEPEAPANSGGASAERPRSTPPVRKLARDLGVDLGTLQGSGPQGLITRDDVMAAQGGQDEPADASAPAAPTASTERETRTPIKGVRKHTAAAMVTSAFTAPHVTEFLTVDVTESMELLARLKSSRAFADVRINVLTLVAKALCIALDRNPTLNSRWDEAAQEIVQHHYVNLGIAAATPRGLMVPNIKDAQALGLRGLADALKNLTDTARAGKTSPADLSGGTISITNVGVFGIDAGTPILNPGEAAILAMGSVRKMPWEHRNEIALRQVMTLSLSFDHRLVDGEQGSRFLADLGTILSDPGMVLTMV